MLKEMMEEWEDGRMECWKIGIMEERLFNFRIHYSIIPSFQYSKNR